MRVLTQQAVIVFALLALLGATCNAQQVADVQSPSAAADGKLQGAGNAFVTRVLAMLERRPNIAARVRHRVRLGEQVLTGKGDYWQQGLGDERRTRLEVHTLVAGEIASLVQVFDGRNLWTDRRLPSGRKVTRLDPIRLQAGLARSAPMSRQGRPTTATSLLATATTRGGLSGQLADLVQHFDFDPPRTTQLGGMPVFSLVGRWKPTELKRLWPESTVDGAPQADKKGGQESFVQSTLRAVPAKDSHPLFLPERSIADWPSQLPHHVLLLVGKQDLFPYVIEHRGSDDAQLANTAAGQLPTSNPLSQFELFEVQFTAALDSRQFEFPHSDIPWTNETPQLIQRLQAASRGQ